VRAAAVSNEANTLRRKHFNETARCLLGRPLARSSGSLVDRAGTRGLWRRWIVGALRPQLRGNPKCRRRWQLLSLPSRSIARAAP
jgi:hypothetical protein